MPENDDFIELFVRKLLDDHCEMCGTSANILEFMRQIKMRCRPVCRNDRVSKPASLSWNNITQLICIITTLMGLASKKVLWLNKIFCRFCPNNILKLSYSIFGGDFFEVPRVDLGMKKRYNKDPIDRFWEEYLLCLNLFPIGKSMRRRGSSIASSLSTS